MGSKRVTFHDKVAFQCFCPSRKITKDPKAHATTSLETPLRLVASAPRLTVTARLGLLLGVVRLRRTTSHANLRDRKYILLV